MSKLNKAESLARKLDANSFSANPAISKIKVPHLKLFTFRAFCFTAKMEKESLLLESQIQKIRNWMGGE